MSRPQLDDLEQHMSIQAVAKALELSDKTVRKMISRGDLKGSRVGRVWRIAVASVNEYLAAHANKPKGGAPPEHVSST